MSGRGNTAKTLAQQMGMSKRWAEQIIRVNKYPEIAEMVKNQEITLNMANEVIRAIEQGKEYITLYAKIPLDDPVKASKILFNAMDNGRATAEYMQELGAKLLGIE